MRQAFVEAGVEHRAEADMLGRTRVHAAHQPVDQVGRDAEAGQRVHTRDGAGDGLGVGDVHRPVPADVLGVGVWIGPDIAVGSSAPLLMFAPRTMSKVFLSLPSVIKCHRSGVVIVVCNHLKLFDLRVFWNVYFRIVFDSADLFRIFDNLKFQAGNIHI